MQPGRVLLHPLEGQEALLGDRQGKSGRFVGGVSVITILGVVAGAGAGATTGTSGATGGFGGESTGFGGGGATGLIVGFAGSFAAGFGRT